MLPECDRGSFERIRVLMDRYQTGFQNLNRKRKFWWRREEASEAREGL
jgi:hypothetical protein